MASPWDLDSLIGELRRSVEAHSWVEVSRDADEITVRAELPGFTAQDVTVQLVAADLVIDAKNSSRSRSCRVRVGDGSVRAAMEHGELIVKITPTERTERIEVGASLAELAGAASAEPTTGLPDERIATEEGVQAAEEH
jgi:HSP20 family molecular chaperone IbpA